MTDSVEVNAPVQRAASEASIRLDDKTSEPVGHGGAPVGPAAEATKPPSDGMAETASPLLGQGESADFQQRWDAIQASFVDEPRRAVEEADKLVASAMKRLAEVFASERQNLEDQWARGEDASTEDLRVALRRYRSFFSRLLAV